MADQVWFGTKGNAQWIPCPSVDVAATKQGYGATSAFLGGGAHVRRSKVSAKRYTMSWVQKSRDTLRPIQDYADGLYGDGFLYYLDPFAMDKNVLPSYIAQPAQNYYDGPWVINGVRPDLVVDPFSVNGYPVESAVYTVPDSSTPSPSFYVPIPPGYKLAIGVHGQVLSGSARVTVTPQLDSATLGSPINLTTYSDLANDARLNRVFSSSTGIVGVNISITSGSSVGGVIQIYGIIAQIIPESQFFGTGPFISGQGSSGLQFLPGSPTYSQYSIALDRVGMSADLVETEAWTWR